MLFRVLLGMALALLAGCGNNTASTTRGDAIELKPVTLASGQLIRVEIMIRPSDMLRGMMFRSQLPPDRGLFFVHNRAARWSYWMHNVRVPLDIIWLDKEHHVVEISANTPPCLETDPVKCPTYGGKVDCQFVLE